MASTKFLDRPGGRIAYDDPGGDGPLAIAAPGMGDTRAVYRHLAPRLSEAGIRLVTMDLRGMGESSVAWDDLSSPALASDYLALIDELSSGPAMLIGNSIAAGASVIAATDAPDRVDSIVLLGPFVRRPSQKWWEKLMFSAVLAPPWGRLAWVSYYRKNMYPGPKPPDFEGYIDALSDNLSEKGRMAALRGLAANTHEESGRRITKVTQPVLVVMGTEDPDFPDPVAEANELGDLMGGEVLLLEGSGHYPQADSPEKVAPAIVDLVRRTRQ